MSETTVHTARLDLRPLGAEAVEALSHRPDGAQ